MGDHVDHILDQWRAERPDLDVSAMAVIARLQRVSRVLEQEIERLLLEYGINLPGFGVLTALLRSGPPYRLTPTELYDSLLVSSGAMTNRLDRLTEAGLVERLPSPNDRRSMLVGLTPKGKRLTNEALTAHTDQELGLLEPLTPAERTRMAVLLGKLLEKLEKSPLTDDDGPVTAGLGERPRAVASTVAARR